MLDSPSSSEPSVPMLGMMPSSGNPTGPVPGSSGFLTNSPFYKYITTVKYCYCNHVDIFVCKTPKFEFLTDT